MFSSYSPTCQSGAIILLYEGQTADIIIFSPHAIPSCRGSVSDSYSQEDQVSSHTQPLNDSARILGPRSLSPLGQRFHARKTKLRPRSGSLLSLLTQGRVSLLEKQIPHLQLLCSGTGILQSGKAGL